VPDRSVFQGPGLGATATDSTRCHIGTGIAAARSLQRPPQLRTNAPSRCQNIPTLRSSTHASSNDRKVSNQRPVDQKSP